MINGNVSHWWQEIGVPEPRPALPGNIDVDVAIVGAGFTGLWSAYYLKKAKPELRVVVLEQRHVGYGASGRNGGWLTNAITGGREQYVPSHGAGEAERFQLAMNETVNEVIRVSEVEGIEADIKKGGEFTVAYTPAQEARLRKFVNDEAQWESTNVQLLESAEAMAKVNVHNTHVAAWHPHSARIQPAKLISGLAIAAELLGVEIYENTRVEEILPHRVLTTHGSVSAEFVVRATEGFTAGLRGLKRLWLPMNSSLIATEPLPKSVWEELNWSNGEVVGDFAHVYMYAQRTHDDRVAIGGRGVPYKYGSKTDLDGQTPEATVKGLREILKRMFPLTKDSSIDHVWSGVLGVPRDWSATVGLDMRTGIAWGGGYVGTGVTSTNLAGRTITDLILGKQTELTTLPWVNHTVRKWEPEPLRWIATKVLYKAYGFADRSELNGRSTTSPVAHLADVVTGK
ncbi:MAG: FAD-binding oxidoreductase [Actinomycetia bacterium]|jgi:glycine/D-amino acid oxidase-like deaminating enzyme|nr:FAD-binding oxidoreductase [Actinomycetes bacterium]MCH9831229.1 FAD-binding oxidoreductase [Actinomycetes bacterium]MCH9839789.1 FAD-binding oxidoreductase [Actinomycetes bacterium]